MLLTSVKTLVRQFRLFSSSDAEWKERAKGLKNLAYNFGLKDFPVILLEPEQCANCRSSTLLLMHPREICDECFIGLLRATLKGDLAAQSSPPFVR